MVNQDRDELKALDNFTETVEEKRRQKVLLFWNKRRDRRSNNYVYHCRVKFASSRLRIRGRFLTPNQAATILGVPVG